MNGGLFELTLTTNEGQSTSRRIQITWWYSQNEANWIQFWMANCLNWCVILDAEKTEEWEILTKILMEEMTDFANYIEFFWYASGAVCTVEWADRVLSAKSTKMFAKIKKNLCFSFLITAFNSWIQFVNIVKLIKFIQIIHKNIQSSSFFYFNSTNKNLDFGYKIENFRRK